ncbi:MAG: group II truncated hemoglobin [Acidimicrobiia bacterium]|nr:group II truncated hemoglobin [Acidimicrobiia bacterium]
MNDPRPAPEGNPWGPAETPYAGIGGDQSVRALADAFYDRIEAESPGLRAMLPRNTTTSRDKLYEFLSGWLGGPQLYLEKRGHPRLRMRHFPFSIGQAETDEWVRCMELAMDDIGVDGSLRTFLSERFQMSAHHVRNES